MSEEVRLLAKIVREHTVVYRKGDIVKTNVVNGMRVVSIDAFPEAPYHGTLVDLHFVEVGFTEASADKQGFLDALTAAIPTDGEFTNLSLRDFEGGPSYITIGGWIGDQTLALQFMALCQFNEIGEVITPATLGIEGEQADLLAGRGMVMMMLRKGALEGAPSTEEPV